MFVGTRGAGFYQIIPATFTVTRFPDTAANDLYNGAIETIYFDDANPPAPDLDHPEVFFCTMGAGLWHNVFTLSTSSWGDTWTRD
jgi:hypothetical protein